MTSETRLNGVRSFRDLIVWQRPIELNTAIYQVTHQFPTDERFGLTSQIRRASVSISSNIAEGHGRGTRLQLIHFLSIARGSTFEVQSQLLVAESLNYSSSEDLRKCDQLCDEVSRMLFATMQTLRAKTP